MKFETQKTIYHVLRIATAMCFIGHGAFGIITKEIWCNYFAVFGIGRQLAYQLMPVLGIFDILLGLAMLVYPVRAIPAWLVIWGIVTALLRPLSGEPVAEFMERAGNYGAPLALLLLCGLPATGKGWFTRIDISNIPAGVTKEQVGTCLKIVVCLLFAGHGWLNLIGKAGLLKQYSALGFANPVHTAQLIGVAELAAALLVLVKPLRPVLFVLFIWKMGSEMLYPHYMLFEWIERGGSYGCLLALWIIAERHSILSVGTEKKYGLQEV